jgi:hypothetical protein
MKLKSIRQGQSNPPGLVKAWQAFLRSEDLYTGSIDGVFGASTHAASVAFQARAGLTQDGWVGNSTWGAAMALGLNVVAHEGDEKGGPNWPPRPPDAAQIVGTAGRQAVFGKFRFSPAPVPGNPEAIRITDDWVSKNIVKVDMPWIKDLRGSAGHGHAYFHRLAAPQVTGLWKHWEREGLIDRVETWAGSWVPRFIRGSRSVLSNHAFGTAFDINAPWNGLGRRPALVGEKGSVRELVDIAHQWGWFWGGWFGRRSDGMHFEIGRILSQEEIDKLTNGCDDLYGGLDV